MPRPAGRRWARLRSGSSRATNVLARVTRVRRLGDSSHAGTQVVYPQPDRPTRRRGLRVGPLTQPTVAPDPTVWARVTAPDDLIPSRPVTPEVAEDERATPVTIPLLPGERTPARRLKFAIANGCTIGSLMLGMTAVFLALAGDFRLAALALLACVVFDGCDGGLARKFGVASPFGAQMDSLADLSSFGVATAIVVFEWLVAGGASPLLA